MSKKKSNAVRRAERLGASEEASRIRKEYERKERQRRSLWIGAGIAVALTLILAIGFGVQSARDTTGQVSTPPAGVVDDFAVPRGGEAPVTVTVYEDFMCPFCGDFEAAALPVFEKYVDEGKVQVQYRVVSFLDRASDGSDFSTRSMNALGVVLDAAGEDVAIRFHDLIFEQQPEEGTAGPSDDELIDLAVEAGATESDVSGPIKAIRFEQWVENATDDASKQQVTQTPTVLVDDKTIEFETIDELVADIEAAIQAGN